MIPVKQLTKNQKIEIGIELRDTPSFFKKYFEILPFFDSGRECFDYLNEIYIYVFKTTKYSSYNSFRQCLYRDGKNYLKL